MKVTIKGLEKYKKSTGPRICLGTFDGFHKGHQKLSKQIDFMVTFSPHPKEVLHGINIPRLTTPEEQKWFFPNQLVIEFTPSIAKMTASDFLNKIIKPYLNPSEITVGYDFRFGVKGAGNIDYLTEWGNENQCKIHIISKQVCDDNVPFKSSIIREEIKTNPNQAIKRLGHPYLILGNVIHGEKRGRKIGFPTANLKVEDGKCIPKFGVYKSHVIINKILYKSISYIGRKPSFEGNHPSIETHILDDFNQSVYNQSILLFLEKFIREEQTFKNKESLITQINADIKTCYS